MGEMGRPLYTGHALTMGLKKSECLSKANNSKRRKTLRSLCQGPRQSEITIFIRSPLLMSVCRFPDESRRRRRWHTGSPPCSWHLVLYNWPDQKVKWVQVWWIWWPFFVGDEICKHDCWAPLDLSAEDESCWNTMACLRSKKWTAVSKRS